MTKAELAAFRNTLLTMRKRLNGDVSHLANEAMRTGGSGSARSSSPPPDQVDQGADNFEQEFTLSLLQNQEHVLEEIAGALQRIEDGHFGRCEECQSVIPKARLQALPYTRHCVACARKIQQST
jgi:RNA polymerase-binding protein DksA